MSLPLLLLPGTAWPLLAIANLPIGRTAENRMQASRAATKLLRWLNDMSGCSFSSAGSESRQPSSKPPWSLWGCAIARSVPVERMLQRIMRRILSIASEWTSGEEKWKLASRWWNPFVNGLLTAWLMFLVLHSSCPPPPGPNSGEILNLTVI